MKYISQEDLLELLGGNSMVAIEILHQFILQFTAEIRQLNECIDRKDLYQSKRVIHSIKTSVQTVKTSTPILPLLKQMDLAEDNEPGWHILSEHVNLLNDMLPEIISEAHQTISGLAE